MLHGTILLPANQVPLSHKRCLFCLIFYKGQEVPYISSVLTASNWISKISELTQPIAEKNEIKHIRSCTLEKQSAMAKYG